MLGQGMIFLVKTAQALCRRICGDQKLILLHVGADLDLIRKEAAERRRGKPIAYTNCKTGSGLDQVVNFILKLFYFAAH